MICYCRLQIMPEKKYTANSISLISLHCRAKQHLRYSQTYLI
nr:MAG TPA: hypothetical protein [Crassvirales sp.]